MRYRALRYMSACTSSRNLALLASALTERDVRRRIEAPGAVLHRKVLSHAREFQQTGSGVGGARRDRTDDLLLAKQALSQLSYGPFGSKAERSQRSEARRRSPLLDSDFWLPVSESLTMVGLGRLELPTSRLSGVRSNRLSYRPDAFAVASCLKKEKRRRRNPALSLDPVRFLRPVRCLGRADMASVRAHP